LNLIKQVAAEMSKIRISLFAKWKFKFRFKEERVTPIQLTEDGRWDIKTILIKHNRKSPKHK